MFYVFNQNNSGGRFTFDAKAGISNYVIVEADNANDADDRAESIGLYFNGCADGRDCECCGDRWSRQWRDDGYEVPSIYKDQPIVDGIIQNPSTYNWKCIKDGPEGFIHFKDGTIAPFDLPLKEVKKNG